MAKDRVPAGKRRRVGELGEIRALLTAVPAEAAVSHVSALRLLGCPVPSSLADDRKLHVTVPPGKPYRGRKMMTVHRKELPTTDRMTVNGVPLTIGSRVYLDLSPRLSREALVIVGDGLLREGWATRDELLARAVMTHGRLGVTQARKVAMILDGRAQSPPESMLRVRIIDDGLPPPEPQCPITTADGEFLARADLGWRRWRVAGEYEGRQHADDDQFRYDIARYTAISAEGWIVLRACRSDLLDGSRGFLTHLRRTLRNRGAPC